MLQNLAKTSCGVFFLHEVAVICQSSYIFIAVKLRTAVGLEIKKKAAGQVGDFLFIRTNQIQSAYSTKFFYCVHYVPQKL